MSISELVKGISFGLAIAAPVGPIGLLCIRRTLGEGVIAGLVTGLGAATADAIYGSIGAFSLTFIANFLLNYQKVLQLIGGLFLIYLGMKILITKPNNKDISTHRKELISYYSQTFLLTLTNPLTIFAFTAIFAGLGLGTESNFIDTLSVIAGIFIGSILWWCLLSISVNWLKAKISLTRLNWINQIAGVAICGFGAVSLAQSWG